MTTTMLLLAVPMMIVAAIAQYQSQSVIREQSLTLNTRLAEAGVEKLETSSAQLDDIYRSIYLNKNFCSYLSNHTRVVSYSQSMNDANLLENIFLSSLSSRSDLYSIIYIDNEGHLTYATRDEGGYYSDYRTCGLSEGYTKLVEHRDGWTGGLRLLPTDTHMPLRNVRSSTPLYVYTAARRIVNTEDSFEPMGVMFITIDLSDLARLADLILPDQSSTVYICNAEGKVIYDSSGKFTAGSLPSNLSAYLDGEAKREVVMNGKGYIMVSAKAEDLDWYVLTLIPEAVYTADAMSVSVAILAAAAIALLIAALVTTFTSGTISQPVEQLAEAMADTGIRHLNRRVKVYGSDEIARLGKSFNTLMDHLNTSIQNEYEMELRQKDAAIRALQAQMNPHFLYNVLQSIASMAVLREIPEIATMSNALGRILRYNIKGATTLATVRDETEHVVNYLSIQKIRFGDRLCYEMDVPEYVMNCKLPRVTLQPMVENAIIHGFERQQETGHISICCWMDEEQLVLEVSDDGKGISPARLKAIRKDLDENEGSVTASIHGIGISNLNARLKLLYGDKGKIEIGSDQDVGTVVRILLPVRRG